MNLNLKILVSKSQKYCQAIVTMQVPYNINEIQDMNDYPKYAILVFITFKFPYIFPSEKK